MKTQVPLQRYVLYFNMIWKDRSKTCFCPILNQSKTIRVKVDEEEFNHQLSDLYLTQKLIMTGLKKTKKSALLEVKDAQGN